MLDAESGIPLWQHFYPSPQALDYGNSPRVTPIISEQFVYTLGAGGQLHCLDIEKGTVQWESDLSGQLNGRLPQWGYAVSPVLIDDQLVVQPGGVDSAWVALNPTTGKVLWRSPGRNAAYASPIVLEHLGQKQIVAYDSVSLGGWSTQNGKRLWEMKPEIPKDFNVPTPVLVNNKICVVTENNGIRAYSLRKATDGDFEFELNLDATSDLLSGDSHSPVRVGDWVVGVDRDLVVMDPENDLEEVARFSDSALQKHSTLLVEEDRVWVSTGNGTQILLRIDSSGIKELGRFRAMDEVGEIFSHPAICNGVLYLRGPNWIDAYSLSE